MRTGLLVLVVVAACGGDDTLSINATADNVCDQIAAVGCHDLYQCCSEGEIEKDLNVTDPRTEDQCRGDLARLCERTIAPYSTAIKAGTVKFDAKPMNDCLNALVAPGDTCAEVVATQPWAMACMTSAWTGTVADGGTCHYKFECTNVDSYCAPNETCTPLPGNGQMCGTLGCATGLYCGTTDRLCHPKGQAGAMCTSSTQCDKGFFCDTQAQMCAALRNPGEACTGNASCVSGSCLPGTCMGSTSTCYTNTDCFQGHCSISGASCTQAYQCGAGTCSMTATTCTLPTDCTGVGNTCVYPQQCLPGTCVGQVVCADKQLVVDYCRDTLNALPVPH